MDYCHTFLAIQDVRIYSSRIYLHDIDVLCGFIICMVNLFIFMACALFVVIVFCYTAYVMCQWPTALCHK